MGIKKSGIRFMSVKKGWHTTPGGVSREIPGPKSPKGK